MASLTTVGLLAIALLVLLGVGAVSGSKVDSISPNYGSMAGGTRLTISGSGFSPDPFNFGEGNEDKGNLVFLINSYYTVICDVIPYYSNTEKITCDTRSLGAEGDFYVSVTVDNIQVTSYCNRDSWCTFTYRDDNTPTMSSSVQPLSGLPGSILSIRGRIITENYEVTTSYQNDGEDEDDEEEEEAVDEDQVVIVRVHWGNYICDMFDPVTQAPYKIELESSTSENGEIQCIPKGTYIASQKIAYLVSDEYGRSLSDTSIFRVSGRNRLYHYQAHADVLDVSPTLGSTEGGTVMTITGRYFDERDSVVLVGGVPCEVFNISTTEILCITGRARPQKASYPGARGLQYQVWKETSSSLDAADWDTNATDYNHTIVLEAASTAISDEEDHFISRLNGFFVPPYTGEFEFVIRGDDVGDLFLGPADDPTNMTKIAYFESHQSQWHGVESQVSERLQLVGGESYRLEARHREFGGDQSIEIGVVLFEVPINTANTTAATNELQEIVTTSTVFREQQTLTINGGTFETQEVYVDIPACPTANNSSGGCETPVYNLQFDGQTTADISVTSSALEMEAALNDILEGMTVSVTKDDEETMATYTVIFNTEDANVALLTVVKEDANLTVTVTRVSSYVAVQLASFALVYDSIVSSPLSSSSTAEDMESALLDMISVKCETYGQVSGYYVMDYEGDDLGYINGDVINDQEPYCGRWSVKNPFHIYHADRTLVPGSSSTVGSYNVRNHQMVCFGHRGAIKTYVQVLIDWIDVDLNDRRNWQTFSDDQIQHSEGWEYTCTDLWTFVQNSWIYSSRYSNTQLMISRIRLFREDGHDMFVDNLYIGSTVPQYNRVQPAASPNGVFIMDVTVSKNGPSYAITMTPANCGYDFPLLGLQGANVSETANDTALYTNPEWTDSVNISVERQVAASPPIGGSFDINLYNVTFSVPATSTAKNLKDALQANLDIGALDVYREGSCTGYSWEVEWTSRGGRQPLMQVNGSELTGAEVDVTSHRVEEGRLLMGPIPGEFLRLAHTQPQVEVLVNGIPSSCSNDQCSFDYSDEATPKITSSSPSSGSAYNNTVLTLTGTGFSPNAGENNVTINGVECAVTSHSETSILCAAGESAAGVYNVSLVVEDKGTAAHTNGQVTFQYELGITGIDPTSGSLAGGTRVNITGYGFDENSDNTVVNVGDKECIAVSISYDEIQCIIAMDTDSSRRRRRRSTLTVDLVLIVNGLGATLDDVFTFDSSLTPTVNSISPNVSSVQGGGFLIISGSGFGTTGAEVAIGDTECVINEQTDAEINCTIPAHAPGTFYVQLSVVDQGFAEGNGMTFKYELDVTGLFPDQGSLYGGTSVTITGVGFGTSKDDVSVSFGGFPCDIDTVQDDAIECQTTSSTRTHYVDNFGRHELYGLGYRWNPQMLDIAVGETVAWQWGTQAQVTGIGYAIRQTTDQTGEAFKADGFSSGEKSANGNFAFRFSEAGTYYYSSGPVDEDGTLVMLGIVHVSEPSSSVEQLIVEVGDYEALHITDADVEEPVVLDVCAGNASAIPQCSVPKANKPDDSSFYFTYWQCSTPTITGLSPTTVTPSQLIYIQGTGFSSAECQNRIYFDSFACTPQGFANDSLTCLLDTEDRMPVGSPQPLLVVVGNRGAALNQFADPAAGYLTLRPEIDGMSAHAGSLNGGTEITITGAGFLDEGLSIWVGSSGCLVQSVSYSQVVCVTTPASPDTVELSLSVNSQTAECLTDCSFMYAEALTPIVSGLSPTSVSGPSTNVTVQGYGFGNGSSDVVVTFGGVPCNVTAVSDEEIHCAVGNVPVGTQEVSVVVVGKGAALFNVSSTVESGAVIDSVSPDVGSTEGGQTLTILGSGFVEGSTTVDIGGADCAVESVTLSEVTCVTSDRTAGVVDLVVTSDGKAYPAVSYEFSASVTPTISSVAPASGVTGDSITISGSSFSSDTSDVAVFIDGVQCAVTSAATDAVGCDLGAHSAGTFAVVVFVSGKGLSSSDTMFEYTLTVSTVSPVEGSFGGGRVLNIDGAGFDETAVVLVCNNECQKINSTSSLIECDVPANNGSGDVSCDVSVTLSSGATETEIDAFTYRSSLTPVISQVEPVRGGTAGGTTLTITGTGFESSGNVVTIGGTVCAVQTESNSQIVCETGAHSPPEMAKVRVEVGDNGIATQDNADFYYIDVWSSRYTWGNADPPIEGDFVIVPQGQLLLLDVSTPILKMLLIQGGSVIFDEADIELHAENILIVDGGLLQVGTEEEPFQHEATIEMHGHVRSQELPLFGAKTLAVRNGTLDLHGKPVPVTWTRLGQTAAQGATSMTLEQAVSWKAGEQMVIASTGHRHSQRENEFLTITAVSNDGTTLEFEPPLEYEHLGITQNVEGVVLEMRAEVGLLTRNVKFRGSVQEEWTETYEACPEEFDTNQFATQTCFLGRFGEETGSDQFGAQMMLFAKYQDQMLVIGRIEYVEVTHAGQAFRLGRYPIHFHLNGDVTGSYVRGCGIHHTFNRAVTIHAVHNLLVERNVAYNIMGHAYFLEDGIETGTIIQDNLGVFVRSSSSLLNVDITPATFWVTNPDNTVRNNAAAGGSHFGFWYNMPAHPEGPSFTADICPRNVPLREFRNNTAHAMGWYGIWIFPTYHPKVGGACGAWEDEPAKYYSLYAWEVERGAEAVAVGAIQFHDFVISDAVESGVEYQSISASWGGSLIKDLTVIAYSDISSPSECTKAGIQGPKSDYLSVDGGKFINFDQSSCAVIRTCGHCKFEQGGFSVRLQGLEFINSPNKAAFKWQHEFWLEDQDGSLTGSADHIVTPSNPNLPPNDCTEEDAFSVGIGGSQCDTSVRLHRFAFNNPLPSSLLYKEVLFTNSHGTSRINYHKKRITHPYGWMVTLIDGDNYNFFFKDVDHVTNISYTGTFYNFEDGDYVILNHNFTQRPDKFATIGVIKNSTESVPTYQADDNGDWHFNNDTRIFSYIVSGKGESSPVNRNVDLDVYQCFYKDCLPPVPEVPEPPPAGRPEDFRVWSDAASWEDVEEGWSGSPDGEVTDVMILPNVWMVADVELPVMNKLFIYGALEIDDTRDNKLEATYILIQGGRLIIGFSETNPFEHNMKILLNGHHLTPDQPLPNGPNLGSKALGVFGALEIHGIPRIVYWTQLTQTAMPGDDTLTVAAETDWVVGDEIVVATTSYEAWQTETFQIAEVVDAFTFILNGTFAYKHIAYFGDGYTMAAEVGLLTRNIKIEGNDYNDLYDQSFGARVIVGQFIQNGVIYKGYANLTDCEFYHAGQEGWTDFYDPRYALAFLDVGEVSDAYPSMVKGCSFHNCFSTAIGVFGTERLTLEDNVIHHTVGPGIIVWENDNRLIHNLVTLVVFPGTYQDRFESENLDWDAGIEVEQAGRVVLINNTVAGSERVAFKLKGEKCFEPADPTTDWYGNVAHSALHGIHMHKISEPDCAKIANFLIYKNWDFGVYQQVDSRMMYKSVTMVDNKVAIMPIIFSPAALSHVTSDKFMRVENSLFVGVSDAFDCTTDAVEPENARQSSGQRGPRPPGGGHSGLIWACFASGVNLAPFFAFHPIMSYPAINGITQLQNVEFRSFGEHCGNKDVMIITNSNCEDATHPMEITGLTMVNVDPAQKIFIHRPNLGSVNPSDCVDMDCDGMKKILIRDLDGSLLGDEGTVIPESEFQWDGDRRRGLGDYRIPKVMLTETDGSRIPVDEKAPNKGIYRGDNNDCVWNANWQAYECHGIDHMMLVVESMDPDTEVRRLTPLAMYSNSYVDLINGPQDNGWCLGYTCQERISTLYTMVATGLSYEAYFTSTNPQTLRLHLLNANNDQAVVVGIWYANPQRLDVYYQNNYVTPNNADFSTGEFTWRAKDPSLPADQYNPSVESTVFGENYFDRETMTQWLLVRGSEPVEIRTTAVIMVTFGVPAVAVDDFYEVNLVANLAALLNVEPSQIRVVEVVSESSRRRRRSTGQSEVTLEIGPQPELTVDSPGSDLANQTDATEATPTGTQAPGSLDFDEMVELQAVLVDTLQSGELSNALNTSITSLVMTDPVAPATDPTGGVRATNETGGSSDVPNGTKTFAELQREAEEEAIANVELEIEYSIPDHLALLTQPSGAKEGAAFFQQPIIYVVDALGNRLDRLGLESRPWQLTASVDPSTPNAESVQLSGNLTVPFSLGWANYTDLAVAGVATEVKLSFAISHPNTSTLAAIASEAFDVEVRPYYLTAIASPTSAYEDTYFEVVIQLLDEITMQAPQNLSAKGLDWHATIAIDMPTNYRGQLQGDLTTTFDMSTAQATFANLSIDAVGLQYVLVVAVETMPIDTYQLDLTLDPFDVTLTNPPNITGASRRMVLRFPVDYDLVAAGKEDQLTINFLNYFNGRYGGVAVSDVLIERGSILISFTMQGDVETATEDLWSDVQGGRFSLEFDGYTLEAEEYLLVDGAEYGVPVTAEPPMSAFPIWAIIIIVVVVIAMFLLILLVVVKLCCKRGKKEAAVESAPLTASLKLKEFASASSLSNPLLKLNDEPHGSLFSEQNGSESPNTPRRTPEVEVTALPPGFTEATGQEERVLEERVKMLIMVKNQDGTFQKLGAINANKLGTMRALRDDVKRALPGKVRDRQFILLDETLKEIDGAREKKSMLSDVYRSECILLRWVKEQDVSKLCVCGLVGQFECSLCRQQTYCSPQCQSSDWVRHSMQCSSYAVASVDNGNI